MPIEDKVMPNEDPEYRVVPFPFDFATGMALLVYPKVFATKEKTHTWIGGSYTKEHIDSVFKDKQYRKDITRSPWHFGDRIKGARYKDEDIFLEKSDSCETDVQNLIAHSQSREFDPREEKLRTNLTKEEAEALLAYHVSIGDALVVQGGSFRGVAALCFKTCWVESAYGIVAQPGKDYVEAQRVKRLEKGGLLVSSSFEATAVYTQMQPTMIEYPPSQEDINEDPLYKFQSQQILEEKKADSGEGSVFTITPYKQELLIKPAFWQEVILPKAKQRLEKIQVFSRVDFFALIPCLCDKDFRATFIEKLAKQPENEFQLALKWIPVCFKAAEGEQILNDLQEKRKSTIEEKQSKRSASSFSDYLVLKEYFPESAQISRVSDELSEGLKNSASASNYNEILKEYKSQTKEETFIGEEKDDSTKKDKEGAKMWRERRESIRKDFTLVLPQIMNDFIDKLAECKEDERLNIVSDCLTVYPELFSEIMAKMPISVHGGLLRKYKDNLPERREEIGEDESKEEKGQEVENSQIQTESPSNSNMELLLEQFYHKLYYSKDKESREERINVILDSMRDYPKFLHKVFDWLPHDFLQGCAEPVQEKMVARCYRCRKDQLPFLVGKVSPAILGGAAVITSNAGLEDYKEILAEFQKLDPEKYNQIYESIPLQIRFINGVKDRINNLVDKVAADPWKYAAFTAAIVLGILGAALCATGVLAPLGIALGIGSAALAAPVGVLAVGATFAAIPLAVWGGVKGGARLMDKWREPRNLEDLQSKSKPHSNSSTADTLLATTVVGVHEEENENTVAVAVEESESEEEKEEDDGEMSIDLGLDPGLAEEEAKEEKEPTQESRYFRDAPLEYPSSVAREDDATDISPDRPAAGERHNDLTPRTASGGSSARASHFPASSKEPTIDKNLDDSTPSPGLGSPKNTKGK